MILNYINLFIRFSKNSCLPDCWLIPFEFNEWLYKSSSERLFCENSLPIPEWKEEYLSFTKDEYSESLIIFSTINKERANKSIDPIWAWNKSLRSVEFLLVLASKFIPPPFIPPDLIIIIKASTIS